MRPSCLFATPKKIYAWMNIAVIGTGYVGLVTGTCLAEMGNHVTCVDIDDGKIESLNHGKIPIYEPGLDVLFDRNIRQNRLSFGTSLEQGIKNADIIFLALPTPAEEDGSADLKYVLSVAEEISPLLTKYVVIVAKSTVPVGTAEKITEKIAENSNVEFDVVSNPEFLREGVAVDDFMKPDRVVIGTTSERAKRILEDLYAPLVRQGNPVIFMDERSAELTKYAANSFLATKISFMNEIANLCEKLGANVDSVRNGMGPDSSEYDALKDADALLIMTEWPVFRTPDFEEMARLMKNKVIFDGRNLYSTQTMFSHGFTYYSIGREYVHGN